MEEVQISLSLQTTSWTLCSIHGNFAPTVMMGAPGPNPMRRWALRLTVALAAMAVAPWLARLEAVQEALGFFAVPDRCSVALDAGLARTDFRIDYFRRDEPHDARANVFDGGRCRLVPSKNGETYFHIKYRGTDICVAGYLKGTDAALLIYKFKCSGRTGRVVCSTELGDGSSSSPLPTSCHRESYSDQPAF